MYIYLCINMFFYKLNDITKYMYIGLRVKGLGIDMCIFIYVNINRYVLKLIDYMNKLYIYIFINF